MKKLFAAAVLILGMSAAAHATPIRYVQISTNTLPQQSGSINIQGATISTTTVSSATLTNATIGNATITSAYIPAISTTTISSATITNATISTGKITTGTFTTATISTTTISSATITNATVTGTATLGTANITTGNITTGSITSAAISTMTVSSATITQATVTSTATFNGAMALNGSAGTNGQVATSQGPGTATHWTTVSAAAGGSSGQIQYNNGSALAGIVSAVTASSVTISTPTAIMGSTDGSAASAGYYGEYISTAPASTRFPASATFGDCASFTLTPGDWDVSIHMDFQPNTSSGITDFAFGTGTSPGNNSAGIVTPLNFGQFNNAAGPGGQQGEGINNIRWSVSNNTIIYLKMYQDGGGSPFPVCHATMTARRVR